MTVPIITEKGAYAGITVENYHGADNLLPGPSISSSGLKTIIAKSPRHFWYDSPLNPNRPERKESTAFNIGKAAHDILLLTDRWPDFYHILPKGYDRRLVKWKGEVEVEKEVREAGLTVLTFDQAAAVHAMADAIRAHPFAAATMTAGDPEMTLAWTDPKTGVWLRARPDFLPWQRQVIPDLKTAVDGHPDAFRKAITKYGYAQSAALYLDGITAIFGERPGHWVHVVVEKDPPFHVEVYELPGEDIERGRWLNRFAIDAFARCVETGEWPGYSGPVNAEGALNQVGLTSWARKQIDDGVTPESLAWAEAGNIYT